MSFNTGEKKLIDGYWFVKVTDLNADFSLQKKVISLIEKWESQGEEYKEFAKELREVLNK